MEFQAILLDLLALKRGARFVDAPCIRSSLGLGLGGFGTKGLGAGLDN